MTKFINRLGRSALVLLVALAFTFGITSDALAQIGSCASPTGESQLDVNNVRARILNNGNLFWRGSPAVYEVPKNGGVSAIFASGFWIGGLVGTELRVAAARYGNYEFWTGPLDELGNPPSDCSVYDKLWKVSRSDVTAFNGGASATNDLISWPTGLGAPTLAVSHLPSVMNGARGDEDGIDNNLDGEIDEAGEMVNIHTEILQLPLAQRINRVIDLAGGERPAILGDQMLWWIMNDRGNAHNETDGSPIGIEVHATAFAFNQAGDIGNTTFYKVNIFYKGTVPLTQAYVALFSDPDLGNFDDDYVGSDSTLGVGYVYNADNDDESGAGYGPAPPATGYDFFQGPIVPSVGDTANVSGRKVADFRNLDMTSFIYYNNGGGLNEDPTTATDYYNYFQARWKDGRPVRYGLDGFATDPSAPRAYFMFPTDPNTGEFWSEFNNDGQGTSNPPADRRFVMSSGPFTINPGDQQEVVYGIVWARGADNLDSVTKMFLADRRAQAAFDANFKLPSPPDAPIVTVTPLDRQVAIEWTNAATGNNFLDSYREFNPLGDPDQPFYEFEGYEVLQYSSIQDQQGAVIATYDLANGLTEIIDDTNEDGITELTTRGRDSGLQHAHVVSGLTNYQTYYFGVRGYAYNQGSIPKAFYSPTTRFQVIPAKSSAVLSDAAATAARDRAEADIVATRTVGVGDGTVSADIVNPGAIKECEYRVVFYDIPAKASSVVASEDPSVVDAVSGDRLTKTAAGGTTYDVFCGEEKVFDGSASGEPAPQRKNVFVADGLEFSVAGPEAGISQFLATANAAGPLDPPDIGTFAFNSNGYPTWDLAPDPNHDRPTRGYQQSTNQSAWGIHHGGGDDNTYSSFQARVLRGDNLLEVGVYDYEMRFTAAGGLGYREFEDDHVMQVPFELWRTGIGTPNDPSDDIRLVPVVCEAACGGGTVQGVYDLSDVENGGDNGVSGGADDPATDWVYWYTPADLTPGQAGYDAVFAGATIEQPLVAPGYDLVDHEVFARTILVNWNAGAARPYTAELPETGTVFRITTNKPNQPGDVHSFTTTGLAALAADLDTQKERLEDIGISPNPYKGASAYEVSQITDEVRFTNLPDVATIRVFTLNGTLLKTIVKNSPGTRTLTWNLTTDTQLPLASGMYLIHVDVPGVGEHVMKFGVIKKRIQLNTF